MSKKKKKEERPRSPKRIIKKTDKDYVAPVSRQRNERPSILPEGTEGPEWEDYAWTADDF